ncbi:TetR/AcrR family transcriptional regulator [Streptococcus merionis]|uniref:TetR/AcrR family transcriptional regulator n=1 Tax=Streptococcus merionis TaxID=400065 RepID=UPI003511D0F4
MPRVSKAPEQIKLVFISLLEEKPIEKINVSDITKKAKISRTTFYNHFENMESLIEFTLESSLEEITKILNKNLLFKVPVLTEMLTYILQKRYIFDAWVKYFPNIDVIITDYIKSMLRNSDIVDIDLQLRQGYEVSEKFAFELYVMTIKTIILNWVASGYEESPQEIAEIIHKTVRI